LAQLVGALKKYRATTSYENEIAISAMMIVDAAKLTRVTAS
jgi:hypothetical protein